MNYNTLKKIQILKQKNVVVKYDPCLLDYFKLVSTSCKNILALYDLKYNIISGEMQQATTKKTPCLIII